MNTEKTLEFLLATVVSLGAVMMQEAAIYERGYEEILAGGIIITIGLPGFLFLEYRRRKRIPKEVKPKLKEVEEKWLMHRDYQYDLPWWFTLLQGVLGVGLFALVADYLLFLVPLYVVMTFVVYRFAQDKFQLTFLPTVFVFYTSFLTIPFCVSSLKQPEFLGIVFGINEITSRRVTGLLSLYTLCALVLSSAMLIAHSWRLGLLCRTKLDGRTFRVLIEETLVQMQGSRNIDKVKALCLDVPLVVQLFSQGNWASVVAFGWSFVDRSLHFLSNEKGTVKKAKEVHIYSEEFKSCKKARNDYVHGGRTPTSTDAFNTLKVIKSLLEALKSHDEDKVVIS